MRVLTALLIAAALAAPAAARQLAPPQSPAGQTPPAAARSPAPAAGAAAPVTANTPPADPCVLTPEEVGLKTRMELAMVNPPPPPVFIDPSTGQRMLGCTVWQIDIDQTGGVKAIKLLRGRASAEHISQSQQWLRRLTFLRFSTGWSGIYLMKPS